MVGVLSIPSLGTMVVIQCRFSLENPAMPGLEQPGSGHSGMLSIPDAAGSVGDRPARGDSPDGWGPPHGRQRGSRSVAGERRSW